MASLAAPVALQTDRTAPGSLGPAKEPRKDKQTQAQRIQDLEARLLALEQTVADLRVDPPKKSRFEWLAKAEIPDLSRERAEALCHNLRAVTANRIIIQFPTGDQGAEQRAQWFKEVFERAHCLVGGPEHLETPALQSSLYLATALPVSRETASMFIALRAAGFALDAAFDPDVRGGEERLFVG